MQNLFIKRLSGLLCAWLFPFVALYAQVDTTTYHQLSGVEVLGKVRPSTTRESTPLQVMDKAGMERLGVQDLSEAVKRFSGVTVQDYGGIGGLKTVSVRSLGAKHTAVSYDGVTVTDAQSGQVDISRFSLDNVDMISLSIGQADDIFQTARMYASAGALSIKTAAPRFEQKPSHIWVQVKGGSFGFVNPSLRYEQKLGTKYAATLNADYQHADGQYPFTFTNGNIVTKEKRHNSDIDSYHGEVNFFADWAKAGKMQLKGYWFGSDRGLPGSIVLYSDYHKERLENRNGFVQANYENRLNNVFAFKVLGKFDYAWTRYRDFHSQYENGQQKDVYTQREIYGSASLLYTPKEYWSFSLAEDFFYNTLDATTPKCPFPERLTSLTAVAAQYKDSRLTVTASLLGTFITETLEIGEVAPDRSKLSPAVSLSYRLFSEQNLRLRASYKHSYRIPTFNDLYYDRLGNRELDPEKATQYNIGMTWSESFSGLSLDYVSLSVDGYYNKVKDKIVALPTMFIWKMMNMGKVNIGGLDVNTSAQLRLPASFSVLLDGSYTWQHAVDRTTKGSKIYGDQIPYTPEHAGTVSVGVEHPWLNATWTLMVVGDRYSLQQNIPENLIKGYVEQQLSFNRTFSLRRCSLRLQAEILNIGNVRYDVIRYYPMPGRSFRASVRFVY